jgi:phage-related protein
MKMSRSIVLVLMLCCTIASMAQQTDARIKGVVQEVNNTPIEQATIRLLSPVDSALITGTATNRNGGFEIKQLKSGSYIMQVSFIGYNSLFKNIQVGAGHSPLNLGTLYLKEDAIMLNDAVVFGKAAEVVMRNDTVEYNADSYKVTEGAVLEDLLKKMPGVEIDSEGKITVNGKEIKKIMVDGKEFFSDDPKVASKNLPSKMIDKVQVLDRQSDMAMMTGFDDGDEEPTINLTIKKGMKKGWFGNAYAGYGSQDRYEANTMLNRFMENDQFTLMGGLNNTNSMGFTDLASNQFSAMGGKKRSKGKSLGSGNGITTSGNVGANFAKAFTPQLTLGGNGRYAYANNDAHSKSSTENILQGDSSSYSNEINQSNNISDNAGIDLRMEWKPDSKTTMIFTPKIAYTYNSTNEWSNFNTLAGNLDTVNIGNSTYQSEGEGIALSSKLEFSRKLNDEGRVLSASLAGGYDQSENDGANYSKTTYYQLTAGNSDETIDQQFQLNNNSYNYKAYVSWVEPLGRNNFLQATYSFNQRNQTSLKDSYTIDENGEYTVLDTAYSKSYQNNYINQRASLSFKAQREKYDYTIGMNVDPSYSKSINFVKDTTLSELKRTVVNFSPTIRFNYRFSKQTNLRINYKGSSNQPSMEQLQPVDDISDPLNTLRGNPNLNPSYVNNLNIRFQSFQPESQRAFMFMINGGYTLNDIVSKTSYEGNSGKRLTTYENIDGNWQTNARVMFNTPLRNKRFSVSSMTYLAYNNSNGYINTEKNTNKNVLAYERASISFRSDLIDLTLNGGLRYSGVTNSVQSQDDQNTFNYDLGGSTTVYLPLGFQLESDINYATNSGYTAGYEQNEILWNASASKQFLKNNQGTIRIKMYDILKQRSNISRNVTANYTRDTEYNTLSSYFMVHFIYRFSIFKGGATAADMKTDKRRGGHHKKRPF